MPDARFEGMVTVWELLLAVKRQRLALQSIFVVCLRLTDKLIVGPGAWRVRTVDQTTLVDLEPDEAILVSLGAVARAASQVIEDRAVVRLGPSVPLAETAISKVRNTQKGIFLQEESCFVCCALRGISNIILRLGHDIGMARRRCT